MRRLLELREKGERDRHAQIQYATEEGEKRGEKRGKRLGRESGKSEEKLRIAKEMLERNIDVAIIEQVTELTKEEIEKIQKTQ